MVSSGYSQNGATVLRRWNLVTMDNYCWYVFGEGETSITGGSNVRQ
jgi:hypothetical protein